MHITIVTLIPDMVAPFLNESIIKRAQEKQLVTIDIVNLRDFATDERGTVDARPYGGGAGMVIMIEPLDKALKSVQSNHTSQITTIKQKPKVKSQKIILMSAKGTTYNQKKAQELSQFDHLIIIAGHYEGIDERIMDMIDEEVSMGDFVLTGGEIPAVAVIDSVVRLLPGVLKKGQATAEESFFTLPRDELIEIVGNTDILNALSASQVQLLEYPHYTRPEEYDGKKVPEELLSGDHEKIRKWRIQKAYEETIKKRPDLLAITGKS